MTERLSPRQRRWTATSTPCLSLTLQQKCKVVCTPVIHVQVSQEPLVTVHNTSPGRKVPLVETAHELWPEMPGPVGFWMTSAFVICTFYETFPYRSTDRDDLRHKLTTEKKHNHCCMWLSLNSFCCRKTRLCQQLVLKQNKAKKQKTPSSFCSLNK